MNDINIQQLLRDANNIRTEKDPGDNDAERVGKMFVDIIEYFRTHSGSGSDEGGDTPTPTPTPTPGGNTFNNGIVVTAGGASINGPTNITGALTVNGNITGKTITGDQINSNGTITARGDIESTHGGLTVNNDIRTTNGTVYAPNAVFDYLTVNKSAHFFELILDQLRANKGAILITNGQCKADAVDGYRVYYRAQDDATENPKAIHQSFIVGDLAICQTFGDGVKVGTNTNITTTYYWRAVSAVSTNPVQRSDGKLYHWIELSNATDRYDGSGAPKIGDEIVQLGFNNSWRREFNSSLSELSGDDLISRQSAIIISAYQTKDTGVVPPSLAFYQGIDNFVLGNNQRGTYIDAKGGFFKGVLSSETRIQDGGSLDVNTETYQLIPSNNPIIKGNPSVTFSVFKSTGGSGNLLAQIDLVNEHLQCKAYNGTTQIGNTINPIDGIFTVSGLASLSGSLTVDLIDSTETDTSKKKTRFTTSFVDLGTVTNGVNGQYTQFVFKNAASRPTSTPRNNVAFEEEDNGWVSSPSDPPTGQVTWVTLRIVTPQADGTFRYTSWSAILQFSSISGLPGASHQQAFKVQSKTATPPTTPTSDSNYPPTGGWVSSVPTSVAEGNVIYFTERVVTPTGENTYDYGAWSTPMIYNGIEGAPGESWRLVPIQETFEVRITTGGDTAVKLDDVVGALYTNLNYAIIHTIGDVTTEVSDLSEYSLKITSDKMGNLTDPILPGAGILSYSNDNYLSMIASTRGGNWFNYYYLHNQIRDYPEGASDVKRYMPTYLTVCLMKNNAEVDKRVVNLIFSPSGYFGALQDGLISMYQGLSGNTDTAWQSGFSQIRQTWDNIRLGVSNIESSFSGTTLPADENIQYAYYGARKATDPKPAAPVGDVTSTARRDGIWTTNANIPLGSSGVAILYYSRRTRKNTTSSWGAWEEPSIYKYWDAANQKIVIAPKIINAADLDIKADEIKLTVQEAVDGINESISEIDQKANQISLSVTQKTAGNKNYLIHSSFEDASLLASNWEKKDNGVVDTTIIHSVWRGATNVSSPVVPMTLTRTSSTSINVNVPASKCAVLSSYAAVALNDSSTARCDARQIVEVSQNQYYTFSVWVKRALRLEEKTCTIRLNIGNVSSSGKAAAFYSSNGTLECAQNSSSTGITVSNVTSATGNCYVDFTLLDDNWHQLMLEVRPSASATAATVEMVVLGTKDTFREVFVSRPMLVQGMSLSAGTSNYMNETYAKVRMYNYSGITNLLSNTDLSTVEQVYAWTKVMSAGGKYIMWDGTQISHDELSANILSRQWSLTDYPNALQISGTVAALAFNNATGYRVVNTPHIYQHFTKDFATSIQNDWLVFSVYVRRKASWANKVYNGNTLRTPLQFALLGQAIDKNSMDAGFETGVTKGGQTAINNPVNSVIQRYVIDAADTDWHRIWLKFKIDKTTANENALLKGFGVGLWTNVETDGVGEDWLVMKPKLEIGETPSMWTDSNDDIKSGLSRTGIDISAGKIVLDAENTEITGNLIAHGDASFGGVIRATTTYSPFVDIQLDEFVGSYYDIDPTKGSNYYLPPAPSGTSHYVRLPNSTTFDGLKLLIFSSRSTRSGAGTNILMYSNGIKYLHPTYKDYYLSATVLQMQYNTLVEVIAIGKQWYVLRGRFSVDGGTTWFDV